MLYIIIFYFPLTASNGGYLITLDYYLFEKKLFRFYFSIPDKGVRVNLLRRDCQIPTQQSPISDHQIIQNPIQFGSTRKGGIDYRI